MITCAWKPGPEGPLWQPDTPTNNLVLTNWIQTGYVTNLYLTNTFTLDFRGFYTTNTLDHLSRITKMMAETASIMRQQQDEIDALRRQVDIYPCWLMLLALAGLAVNKAVGRWKMKHGPQTTHE